MKKIHVAYVLHRFPCLTETFVAEEMHAVQKLGATLHLFSLLPARAELVHPVSVELAPQVHYAPEIYTLSLWMAQLHFLLSRPKKYLALLRRLLAEPAPGLDFLLKRLVIFTKGVWIARQLEGSPVQLVHTHFAWLSAAASMVIGQLLDLPFSVTAHAYDIYSDKSDLLALTTSMADRVVTISEYNKRTVLERSPGLTPQRIDVIRCGIDLSHFKKPARRPAEPAFQITAVGSLLEKKGHVYLVQACSKLAAQNLDFQCVIVGQGPQEQALQNQIRDLDLSGRVTLAGSQTQTWVRDRLGVSDLFVLACVVDGTGERDGIPVAMMEALSMEVPVVSTPVSGIPELIRHEDTGLLVPQREPEALASAILRLAGDRALGRNLAARGRRVVEEEHDICKNAERLVGLFEKMIEA